jgi:hypothetical protein
MTKKPTPSTPHRDILAFPGTDYVLLPDDRVARLLTPTEKSGKKYLALYIEKKRRDFSVEAVVEATTAGKPLTPNS